MKENTCPSCGASYNGKHCRHCGYKHFSEALTHGSHTHKGEPLCIDAPARQPIPRKDPFGCDKQTRNKHPLVRFFLLLSLISALMPMLRNWGLKLETMEGSRSIAAAQPEPILQPENRIILHQEGDITIFTTPEQLADLNQFSLYVRNEGSRGVTVSAGDIQVNGTPLSHAALVCKAHAGGIGKGWLEVDVREWEAAGIQEIRTLSFDLAVLGQDGRLYFETSAICLTAEGAESIWANS